MINQKIILTLFILVALVQLYVPGKMILHRESVLNTGTEYKFKAAPIDPYDPFRGKYITLTFAERSAIIENEKDWNHDEKVFVSFTMDANGFAKIRSVTKNRPTNITDYIEANVSWVTSDGSNKLTIEYPFNTYYMEESKADDAELMYRTSLSDTSSSVYALVSIKNGDAVLKDVLVDGIPIRQAVNRNIRE